MARERRSRVLEYFATQQTSNQEEQQDEGADPFEGLDQSFGLTSGKESSNG